MGLARAILSRSTISTSCDIEEPKGREKMTPTRSTAAPAMHLWRDLALQLKAAETALNKVRKLAPESRFSRDL